MTRSRPSARRRAGRSSARTGRVAAAGTDGRDGVRHSHRVVTAGPSRTPTVRAVAIRACRRAPPRESAGRRWDNRGGGQSLRAPRTTRPAGLRLPPSRGPAPFMRTLAGMPAPPGLTPPPRPEGARAGCTPSRRRSRRQDEQEWPPHAGEVRPSKATHRAVDGRGRIGRTAGDVINLGQQKRLIEGDDAAVVRWRQTDAKRLVREAPSDDLAQLRPQRDVERALRARTRGAGASG